MANTTDIIITCFSEDNCIKFISDRTGIDLRKISNGELCGGPKTTTFSSYSACIRCIGEDKIIELIHVFNNTDFEFPELAVMILSDDNIEKYNCVVQQKRGI